MRVLLVAPHFPPLATPQSLRWHYLSRELARQGVQLHVLTGHVLPDAAQRQSAPEGITVTRVWSTGVSGWWEQWRFRRYARCEMRTMQESGVAHETGLKSWLAGRLYQYLTHRTFPGEQATWIKPAQTCFVSLLEQLSPDVVISSHQPAAALVVGRDACNRGIPWVVDLGDPVMADYSTPAWRERLLALEEAVCRDATAITVTTRGTRDLLMARHATVLDKAKVHVISQGYDSRRKTSMTRSQPNGLELYYSGRIYAFRDPRALLEAVAASPGVRLTMRCPDPPEWLPGLVRGVSGVCLLPGASHDTVLAEQAAADVLVNIGNRQSEQTPGKTFEYLAAQRPILHLSATCPDQAGDDVREWKRGWVCSNDVNELLPLLSRLAKAKSQDMLDDGLVLDDSLVRQYGWKVLGERYAQLLRVVELDGVMSS